MAQEATEMAKPEPHYPPQQCPGSQVLYKVSHCLAKNNMTVIPHPPYSPDLAPLLFPLPQAEASDEGSKIRHH